MRPLSSLDEFRSALAASQRSDPEWEERARARQAMLTKPPGSLGRLEEIATWLAGWQRSERPRIAHPRAIIFAGNHGVVAEGVSPYPAEVTVQMVANYGSGGAAINAIAAVSGIRLDVVPLALDRPTGNIVRGPALGPEELAAALAEGAAAVARSPADLLVFGEMGIGNTTVAAALAAAAFGGSGSDWAGAGTGLDVAGVARKAAVIDMALELHRPHLADPFETLRRLGGREIAAIAGATLEANRRRIPVLLDGFVATAAIAPLAQYNAALIAHCLAGHVSAEQAHRRLLDRLGLSPLLDLGMRLGEGTGAALAVAVVKAAAATHSGMATFGEAGVSDRDGGS